MVKDGLEIAVDAVGKAFEHGERVLGGSRVGAGRGGKFNVGERNSVICGKEVVGREK